VNNDLYSIISMDPILINTKDVLGVKVNSMFEAGLENINPQQNGSEFVATEYFLKGLTPEYADQLLAGKACLVFEIVAMDHSIRTINKRRYPQDLFIKSLQAEDVQRRLNLGGQDGEADHPDIIMPDNKAEAQVTVMKNMQRMGKIEQSNTTHSIIGYRTEGTKTIMKIKTSTDNLSIVRNLINGKPPAFSIRTICKFEPEGDGVVASAIKFICIDYVRDPANIQALASPNITMRPSCTIDKLIKLEMVKSTNLDKEYACESTDNDFNHLIKEILSDKEEIFVESVNGATRLFVMNKQPKTENERILDSLNKLDCSYL